MTKLISIIVIWLFTCYPVMAECMTEQIKSNFTNLQNAAPPPSNLQTCTCDTPQSEIESSWLYGMLLNYTYQHDSELAKITRKSTYGQSFLVGGLAGSYGLALAVDAYVYHNGNKHLIPSGLKGLKERVLVPATLSYLSTGISLGGIGLSTAWSGFYLTKLKKRKQYLKNQVNHVFKRLDCGAADSEIYKELVNLLKNELSASEFIKIWHFLYSQPEPQLMAPLKVNDPLLKFKNYSLFNNQEQLSPQ